MVVVVVQGVGFHIARRRSKELVSQQTPVDLHRGVVADRSTRSREKFDTLRPLGAQSFEDIDLDHLQICLERHRTIGRKMCGEETQIPADPFCEVILNNRHRPASRPLRHKIAVLKADRARCKSDIRQYPCPCKSCRTGIIEPFEFPQAGVFSKLSALVLRLHRDRDVTKFAPHSAGQVLRTGERPANFDELTMARPLSARSVGTKARTIRLPARKQNNAVVRDTRTAKVGGDTGERRTGDPGPFVDDEKVGVRRPGESI